jgi:adenylate cyclase
MRGSVDAASPRRLVRVIWWELAAANLGGALPLLIIGWTYVRRFHPRPTPIPLFWIGIVMTLVLFFPMWATTRWLLRIALRRATAFIVEGREPSEDERRVTTRLPLLISTLPGPWWLLASGLGIAITQALHAAPNASAVAVGTIGILLGGVVSCTLTYLLSEASLRPLFAIVLRTGGAWSGQGRGIRGRLIAYWLAGSGAYFLGIALITIAFPARLARPTAVVCCAIGAVIGITMAILSAETITRPLDKVRLAMQRVASGDLMATVEVDDLGNVGFLQSGFNSMVAGLRERDRLRDAFGRHVGPEVAKRALETGGGLHATELNASVMFVDIVGSTALAAEREPSSVVRMLNAFFAAVVRTVAAQGGHVNQFQGDGALCLFGAPHEFPDHGARALQAARSLRSEILLLGEMYPGFDAAIGVSSGRVVAGDIGTEDRHEYTAIGDPVNEASRLCDEAKKREARVLASEASLNGNDPQWVACGEVALRGRPRPSVIYEPAR